MQISVIWLCGIMYLLAFVITLILVPFSIKLAHKTGAIDIPKDERRVHKKPIPRIGGVAIFAGVTVALIIAMLSGLFRPGAVDRVSGMAFLDWDGHFLADGKISQTAGVILGGTLIFIVGFVDDLKGMKPKVKLLWQIIAASFVFAFGVRIKFISFFFDDNITTFSFVLCYLITVIWIVAITNTINLVDGLDGLAAGVVAIASLCIAYVGYIFGFYIGAFPMLAIAGAALGFLPYNFYPARTFMGDCGSQYLGFVLACFSILGTVKSATIVAVLIPSLALLLPVVDTLLAIIRRAISGKSIMEADKNHLHHRLLRAGMGQRRTVLCIYGMCGVMGVASVLLSRDLFVETLGLLAVAFLYIYIVLTDPHKTAPHLKQDELAEDAKKAEKEKKHEE